MRLSSTQARWLEGQSFLQLHTALSRSVDSSTCLVFGSTDISLRGKRTHFVSIFATGNWRRARKYVHLIDLIEPTSGTSQFDTLYLCTSTALNDHRIISGSYKVCRRVKYSTSEQMMSKSYSVAHHVIQNLIELSDMGKFLGLPEGQGLIKTVYRLNHPVVTHLSASYKVRPSSNWGVCHWYSDLTREDLLTVKISTKSRHWSVKNILYQLG